MRTTDTKEAWEILLQDKHLDLQPFIALAMEDRVLSQLFPFASLYTLCLSRCTLFPYDTANMPTVTAKQYENFGSAGDYARRPYDPLSATPQFVVLMDKREYVGEGDAEVALKLVRDYLPDDIGPARQGSMRT